MTDDDSLRLEAALQFGFLESGHNEGRDDDVYLCTKAQLIAFAKACELAGRRQVLLVMDTVAAVSTPQENGSLGVVYDKITRRNKVASAELALLLEAERNKP